MNPLPHILRISDPVSLRTATLRLSDSHGRLPLAELLTRYLHDVDGPGLLARGAISQESLHSLWSLQDLVYGCDDAGNLTAIAPGVTFRQGGPPLGFNQVPEAREVTVDGYGALLTELNLDRALVGYQRNWAGFHRRRWGLDSALFEGFVRNTLEAELGAEKAGWVSQLADGEAVRCLVKTLAKRIWGSEFENYSRFVDSSIKFKTGDETVRSIAAGAGGICTEKVQALKFLTDHYGIESEYLIGGDRATGPVPVEKLRELLSSLDFRYARRHMRYWQHTALLYHFNGQPALVDATNGNIPFLFLQGEGAERLLRDDDKQSIPVRMVESEEAYYYHQVPQDIPHKLFYALEAWIPDTDLVQVFENELGLFLSHDYYVTPLPFRTEPEYGKLAEDYRAIARRAGYRCEISQDWTLEGPLGQTFCAAHPDAAAKILAARNHLLHRYNEWDIPGHDAGLVIMRLA